MIERHRLRTYLALPALAGLGIFLFWGLSGLPPFGNYHGLYGHLLNNIAVPQRHTSNVVTAIVFDYRGFDTLGEEFILFGAVTGVVLLLRREEGEGSEGRTGGTNSDQLRLVGALMVGAAMLVGVWLIAFGLVTPGGGFQGGVVVSGAVLLVFVASSYTAWQKLSSDTALDPIEGLGVGTYTVVGLAALIASTPFLHNLLGPGQTGTLWSGGSMSFLNWGTALEVAAANVLLYSEFLEEYVAPLIRGRS